MRSIICAIFILTFCVNSHAQSFSEFTWKAPLEKLEAIPEKYENEKAIIINKETYSKGTFTGTFPYIEQLSLYRDQTNVKLLSEESVEDYSRLILQRFKGRIADYVQYKTVDVRILKTSGQEVDLNIRELEQPTLSEDDDLYENRENLIIYSIPGVEVGDQIEIITVIESKFLDQGRIVNLYNAYPTLKSSFTISVPLKVVLKGNIYNGMPSPKVTSNSTNRIFEWTMTDLAAKPEANTSGTIFTKELEHFVYELNFDAFRSDALSFTIQNWSDLIWQYAEDFLKVRIRKKKKLEAFYENLYNEGAQALGKSAADLIPLEKVYLMNEFMVKNLQIVRQLEDFEKSEGIEYFLDNKKSDYRNMMRIYRDFFERNNIEFYLAIGKERFNGPFDRSFISSTQISDYFFVFKVEQGLFTINGLGALNELPWFFHNTTCLMKNINDRKSQLQEVSFKDDVLISNKNKKFSRSQINIDLDNNILTKKISRSSSGLFTQGMRSGIVQASKADTLVRMMEQNFTRKYKNKTSVNFKVKAAKVDKITTMQPFDFKYSYQASFENLMKPTDDILQLPIEEIIGHSFRWVSNAEKRTLDYHFPFQGSDIYDVYLIFNKPVDIENLDQLNRSINSEYGNYEFKITMMKPNMYRIQSKYNINALLLPIEDAAYFQVMNKQLSDLLDENLVIRTK